MYLADDKLLFLEDDSKIIDALKMLLIECEDLYGMKINYPTSEIISFNISDNEGLITANILGCISF